MHIEGDSPNLRGIRTVASASLANERYWAFVPGASQVLGHQQQELSGLLQPLDGLS